MKCVILIEKVKVEKWIFLPLQSGWWCLSTLEPLMYGELAAVQIYTASRRNIYLAVWLYIKSVNGNLGYSTYTGQTCLR